MRRATALHEEDTGLSIFPPLRTPLSEPILNPCGFVFTLCRDDRLLYTPGPKLGIYDIVTGEYIHLDISIPGIPAEKDVKLYQFVDTGYRRGWALFWVESDSTYVLARAHIDDSSKQFVAYKMVRSIKCSYAQARIDRLQSEGGRLCVKVGAEQEPTWELKTSVIIPLNEDSAAEEEVFVDLHCKIKPEDPVEFGGIEALDGGKSANMTLCNRRTRTLIRRPLTCEKRFTSIFDLSDDHLQWQFIGAWGKFHIFYDILCHEIILFLDIETGKCRPVDNYRFSYNDNNVIPVMGRNALVLLDEHNIWTFRIGTPAKLTHLAYASMKPSLKAVRSSTGIIEVVKSRPPVPLGFRMFTPIKRTTTAKKSDKSDAKKKP